ncbi:MAG: hypothetical protein KA801_19295, partial [Syntrophorhabdaceae bacterium]|nr:hypothetical protein [Syntrophorhabdaceae bacterium]
MTRLPVHGMHRRVCLPSSKSGSRFSPGHKIRGKEITMEIKKLGVLGCGQMGSGIVQVFAQAGYEVVAVDTVPAMIEKGLKGIEKRLMGRVDKGKM